jgi:glycerol-3-phosphate dehydrogenase
MADFDLAIVGGGINGTGIARDAAGRGLSVLLVEQHDLASGTSSASTKLIHGGLRYVEHGWFRLVREALIEREVLLRIAPHLVRPIRFVLPTHAGARPAWMLRVGLFIYDHLGGRETLPGTATVALNASPLGFPLTETHARAFVYSDCVVDDTRLVILNALDAAEQGAVIRTRTRCVSVRRGTEWQIVLESRGRRDAVTACALINATGPWLALFSAQVLGRPLPFPLRLDKGSHIVVPRLFDHDHAYIFQLRDHRVVFALPFEQDFTLIGTTDSSFAGDPGDVHANPDEIAYLCTAANQHFRKRIEPQGIVWAFAGVRALSDDGSRHSQDVSRDYHLHLDEEAGMAPLLTVYGGKITTYRRLAEHALSRLAHVFKAGPAWTAHAPLPGGDLRPDELNELIIATHRARPYLTARNLDRLVRSYGTRVERVLGPARRIEELAPCFGEDLTATEVRYLMQREWAQTEEDVLWRRTKLGLRLSGDERASLAQFMTESIGKKN